MVIFYTLFSSLGDFIIMANVLQKARASGIQAFCLHLNNPHVSLYQSGDYKEYFFNVCRIADWMRLFKCIQKLRLNKSVIFGAQQAPGSLRGFYFLKSLKLFRFIDIVVDFNLLNADRVTQPKGNYILDVHLNQLNELFQYPRLAQDRNLILPFEIAKVSSRGKYRRIGIHPWCRRYGDIAYTWPSVHWVTMIQELLKDEHNEVVIFGKDAGFEDFENQLRKVMGDSARIIVEPSKTVSELVNIIQSCDMLISVNTSVVHIGYALHKKMVILEGPALNIWRPKSDLIISVTDTATHRSRSEVSKINVGQVIEAYQQLINRQI